MNKRQKRQLKKLESDIVKGKVDEEILPLVKAIWQLGLPTIASCGGHTDREVPYPYVSVGFLDSTHLENLGKLIVFLGEWNVHPKGKKRDSWVLLPGYTPASESSPKEVWLVLEPKERNLRKNHRVLRRLQDGADKLAAFLLNSGGGSL